MTGLLKTSFDFQFCGFVLNARDLVMQESRRWTHAFHLYVTTLGKWFTP